MVYFSEIMHLIKTIHISDLLSLYKSRVDELTYLAWSNLTPLLAVGSARGNLLLYNHNTQRY